MLLTKPRSNGKKLLKIQNFRTNVRAATRAVESRMRLASRGLRSAALDNALNFDSHVSKICRSAKYHLRALSHIRKFLSVSSANMLVCAIVSSRLDYCNSVLSGL